MKRYSFTIPGKPQPWQRAKSRIAKKNGKPIIITNTHPKNKSYQKIIRQAALDAGVEMITGPVEIDVYAVFKRPSDLSRKKDRDGVMKNTKEVGDIDNLLKNPMDALQGIAYPKDGVVSDGSVKKRYGRKGQAPYTTITIWELPLFDHEDSLF